MAMIEIEKHKMLFNLFIRCEFSGNEVVEEREQKKTNVQYEFKLDLITANANKVVLAMLTKLSARCSVMASSTPKSSAKCLRLHRKY